jgi:uncharacterized protein
MNLELDLYTINQAAGIKEKENFRFRTFLKCRDDNKVDKIVHGIYEKVIKEIDCTQCGNCCKEISPSLTMKEIGILSKMDNLSRSEFIEQHTELIAYGNTRFLKVTPCRYLNDTVCSIYESRPNDCKSFPHIHRKCFNSRTLSMIDYYGICPIVFNVMERLKMALGFRG